MEIRLIAFRLVLPYLLDEVRTMKNVREFRTDNELVVFLVSQNTIIFATEMDYKTFTFQSDVDANKCYIKLRQALCKRKISA